MAKFEAEISANVSGFVKDLNTAEKKADQFGKKVPAALNNTSKGFNSLDKSVGAANSTAMEFNRIIQDAPFGMMGIGNNIQQLTANFGQLKNQTGSTGAALKATFASLLSSGNLLALGVAVATSAWTFYTMSQQKANKATKEGKDVTETFASTLKKYASELNSVNKSKIDSQKTSSQEIATLNTLRSVIENETLSRGQRLKAVEKLKSQYPSYFKDISNEQLLLGNSVSLYQKLTKEIIATGVAMASQRAMGEEYENIANSTLRRQKSLEVINKLETENAKLAPKLKDVFPDIRMDNLGAFTEWEKSVIGTRSLKQMKEAGVELRTVRNNLAEIHKENIIQFKDQQNIAGSQSNLKILNEQINQSLVDGANITGDYNLAKTEQTKAEKDYKRELIESLAQMGYYDAALAAITYKYKDITELARKAGSSTEEFGRIAREEFGEKLSLALGQSTGTEVKPTIKLGIDLDIPSSLPGLEKRLGEMKAPFINFFSEIETEIGQIFEGGIERTVAGFASSIGTALVEGGSFIEAAGKTLLGGLGSILVDLGTMAIKSGIAIEAVKASLISLGGFGAIAAGIALVAIGSAFSAGANKLGKSMGSGGGASGYSSNSVSSSSNAMPNYFQGAYSNNNTVVFEIEGSKLKGVLDRTNRKDNRTR